MGVTAGAGDPPEATAPRPRPEEGERPGLQYVRPIVKSDAPPHPKVHPDPYAHRGSVRPFLPLWVRQR